MGQSATVLSVCVPRSSSGVDWLFTLRTTLRAKRSRAVRHPARNVGRSRKEFGERDPIPSGERERLEETLLHSQENLGKAQAKQKHYYDKGARSRTFEMGEQVLVLLPTRSQKLLAQWQGPYVIHREVGPVNYEVDMTDKRKKIRLFHVNMLRKWHPPVSEMVLMATSEDGDEEDLFNGEYGEIPTLGEAGAGYQAKIGKGLEEKQRKQLKALLTRYAEEFSGIPGQEKVTEHKFVRVTQYLSGTDRIAWRSPRRR